MDRLISRLGLFHCFVTVVLAVNGCATPNTLTDSNAQISRRDDDNSWGGRSVAGSDRAGSGATDSSARSSSNASRTGSGVRPATPSTPGGQPARLTLRPRYGTRNDDVRRSTLYEMSDPSGLRISPY